MIPASVVWNQWRGYKMADEDCVRDLIRSRDRSAVPLLQQLEFLIKKARLLDLEEEIVRIQRMLQSQQKAPRPHPVVSEFMGQWLPEFFGRRARSKCLLFRGTTEQGKSTMATSLFPKRTLKVSCQGLPFGVIPGLHKFVWSDMDAIVWDEIRPDQVLAHRELFQSNAYEQIMSQSACNQHIYGVWVYFVAMVFCANDFAFEGEKLSKEDTAWLRANIYLAELPVNERWYLDD